MLGDEKFFNSDSMLSLEHTRFTEKIRNLEYLDFSENAKFAFVKPVYKKDSRSDQSKHRLYTL